MGNKWNIKKFSEEKNFGLWRFNMQEISFQQKCNETFNGETSMHACLTQVEKTKMVDKDKSFIILYLGDNKFPGRRQKV